MKEIPAQYIAEDGTIFASIRACRQYELHLQVDKTMGDNVKFAAEDGTPTKYFDEAVYVACKDDATFSLFEDLCLEHAVKAPNRDLFPEGAPFLMMYNSFTRGWDNFKPLFASMQIAASNLKL